METEIYVELFKPTVTVNRVNLGDYAKGVIWGTLTGLLKNPLWTSMLQKGECGNKNDSSQWKIFKLVMKNSSK